MSGLFFRDEYGFVNKFACSRESYLAFRDRYRDKKEEMEKTWKKLVRLTTTSDSGTKTGTPPPQTNRSISTPNSHVYKFEPFGPVSKKALRQGIPSHLRPMAWYFYSGGEALRTRHPNPTAFYESLLMQPKPTAFFMLTDRMKMDFRDILPTNELVRRDFFAASNTMINDIPDVGRVRIIPDRSESPNETRPRRMTIFDRDPKTSDVAAAAVSTISTSAGSTPFMSRLYNVLVAFFLFRPRLEYCRAVCTIAAIFLLVIQDEEKTFWTLSAIFSNYAAEEAETFEAPGEEAILFHDFRNDSEETIKSQVSSTSSFESGNSLNAAGFKYFPEEMFRDTSTCSYAALDGFKSVLEKKKSTLVSNLDSLEIPVSLLTTTWFQSVFVDVLPTESSMRVIDAFIGEGFKVLYRVALALFFLNETELMGKLRPRSSSAPGFFSSLIGTSSSGSGSGRSNSPNQSEAATSQAILNLIKFMPKKQVDADVLMDCAFNRVGSLPMSAVLAGCKRAAEVEKPLQSIRRFSQTPETKLSMDTIRRVSTTGR